MRGPPGAAHRLAVEERGALGLISYNSNQRSGWWRDDVDLVRWGHLEPRPPNLRPHDLGPRGEDLRRRLAAGTGSPPCHRRAGAMWLSMRDRDCIPAAIVQGRDRLQLPLRSSKPAATAVAAARPFSDRAGHRKLVDEKSLRTDADDQFVFPSR
jgi:hypothetical protein